MTRTCNIDNMLLWIRELRSDRYAQAFNRLMYTPLDSRGRTQACCLGIVCQVAIDNGLPLAKKAAGIGHTYFGFGDSLKSGTLPPEMQQWLGVDDVDFHSGSLLLGAEPLRPTAPNLNDMLEYAFRDIAEFIEDRYIPRELWQNPTRETRTT